MAFWAYILKCANGRYYTGQTDALDRRLAEHQTGGFCDFTARRRPVTLMWSEALPTRSEALEAERQLKGWSRAKKEALFAGDWKRVSHFARPPAERDQDEPVHETRPSITLGTNGAVVTKIFSDPFASSAVETRHATPEPKS